MTSVPFPSQAASPYHRQRRRSRQTIHMSIHSSKTPARNAISTPSSTAARTLRSTRTPRTSKHVVCAVSKNLARETCVASTKYESRIHQAVCLSRLSRSDKLEKSCFYLIFISFTFHMLLKPDATRQNVLYWVRRLVNCMSMHW